LAAFVFSPYPRKLKKYFLLAFFITLFSIFSSEISESVFFHASLNGNMRPRGFYYESSHYAMALFSFGLISAYFCSGVRRYSVLFLMLVGILYAQSKGAIGVLIIGVFSIFLLKIINQNHTNWKLSFLLFILIVPSLIIMLSYFQNIMSLSLNDDLSTSIATRLSGFIAGIYAIIYFPFGVGFLSYESGLRMLLKLSTDFMAINLAFPLNFSEVNEYIYNADAKGISTKILLSNLVIVFGIPGLILLIITGYRTIKRLVQKNEYFLVFNFLIGILSLSIFLDGISMYPIFMLIGVSVYYAYRKN
jgi:hypothetical protein